MTDLERIIYILNSSDVYKKWDTTYLINLILLLFFLNQSSYYYNTLMLQSSNKLNSFSLARLPIQDLQDVTDAMSLVSNVQP